MTRREWLALGGMAMLGGCRSRAVTVHFQPSDEIFANPERGFYVQRAAEDIGDLTDLRKQGISLLLLTLDLKNYRNRSLDDAKLSVLDEAMQVVRGAGMKVIFRAAYGFTDADYRVDPAELALIRRHISAISKTLTRHAPSVFAVQAGMLGPWGEWHGSTHGDPPSLGARKAVLETWLERLPAKIFLQVRRPMFLRDMSADLKRCGFHNDALLALPDDMGTYAEAGWDRQRELDWCAAHLGAVPFGGETVPGSEATPPAMVMDELMKLRTTYLNSGYHSGTLSKWEQSAMPAGSLLDIIKRRLGYRLVASHLEMESQQVKLHFRNEGFSPPLTPRRVSFAWYDTEHRKAVGEIITRLQATDGWRPENGAIVLSSQLPARPSDGDFVPALRLADDSAALADDGRHCIRLAGGAVDYDEAGGWNLFG